MSLLIEALQTFDTADRWKLDDSRYRETRNSTYTIPFNPTFYNQKNTLHALSPHNPSGFAAL
jgi:hypothetical protein